MKSTLAGRPAFRAARQTTMATRRTAKKVMTQPIHVIFGNLEKVRAAGARAWMARAGWSQPRSAPARSRSAADAAHRAAEKPGSDLAARPVQHAAGGGNLGAFPRGLHLGRASRGCAPPRRVVCTPHSGQHSACGLRAPPTLRALAAQGFDEYMNLTLDEAEELDLKNKSRKAVGAHAAPD